jgi:hypothetical protein
MADRSKNWTQYMDIKQRQDILAPLRSEFITARWDYNRLLQMYKTGVDMAELEVQQGELKKIADGYNHEAEMQFAGIDQKFDHDLYLIHLPDFAQTKEALKSPDAFSLAQHQVPDMQRWTDPMGSAAPLAPDIIKVASAREESLERSSYRQRFDAIRQSLEKIKGLSSTRRRFH